MTNPISDVCLELKNYVNIVLLVLQLSVGDVFAPMCIFVAVMSFEYLSCTLLHHKYVCAGAEIAYLSSFHLIHAFNILHETTY